ncbi:MAG: FMN-binding negative transcriptional regulator [Rhodospirillales bacterium]|jgi:transcriptional regulator|nr:FMN-binding negative transcriptional regulator [Rhodospirillales bacterium]
MHPNKAFRKTSPEQNLSFAQDRGFGVLTVSGSDGPIASHVPFVISDDGTSFGAHLVRSNLILPLLAEDQPALMIVSGPDGYISPDWYGLEDQVPTWNYVAVHLYGTLRKLPDDRLRPHLEALSEQFEKRLVPKPEWKLDKVTSEVLEKMQRMIVPVEFSIERVEGTWKLGQNKGSEAQARAADNLENSELGQMITELADLMRTEEIEL